MSPYFSPNILCSWTDSRIPSRPARLASWRRRTARSMLQRAFDWGCRMIGTGRGTAARLARPGISGPLTEELDELLRIAIPLADALGRAGDRDARRAAAGA